MTRSYVREIQARPHLFCRISEVVVRHESGRRRIEAFEIVTLGDGLVEFLAPEEHARLWVVGPEGTRRIGLWFVEQPERMRVLGATQVVLDAWLALRQHRDIWG